MTKQINEAQRAALKAQAEKIKRPAGMANARELYMRYRHRARTASREFTLTESEFYALTKQTCVYCGSEPATVVNKPRSNGPYVFNGIDRIDNSVGYVQGNVVTCCAKCNLMKGAMSQQTFIDHLQTIAAYLAREG